MMHTTKRCAHCNAKYSYQMSGMGCEQPNNNEKHCPDCMEVMLSALKSVPKRFEVKWLNKTELMYALDHEKQDYIVQRVKNDWPDLNEVLKWKEAEDAERMKSGVRARHFPGLYKDGESSRHGQVKGRDKWEGWTFTYLFFESELPSYTLRVKMELDLIENTVTPF